LVCSHSILDLPQSDGAASFRGHCKTGFRGVPLFSTSPSSVPGKLCGVAPSRGILSEKVSFHHGSPPDFPHKLWKLSLLSTCHPGGTQGSGGNETSDFRPETGVRPAHEPMVLSVDSGLHVSDPLVDHIVGNLVRRRECVLGAGNRFFRSETSGLNYPTPA